MFINTVRNVCEALPATLRLIQEYGIEEESRGGPVLVLPVPLMTVTTKPMERVLFSNVRDANPLFHAVEAIWMLAGRNDSATLKHYIRNFGDNFAESDGRIHDAYGRRWRIGFGFDQLHEIINRLRANPRDRQCVLQMWDALIYRHDDLTGWHRTRPCNTHVYVLVREKDAGPVLDLTVCCRSNDLIWGMTGSNLVHFSILLEYLAAQIGVGIGTMYQLSNNAHVYQSEMARLHERTTRLKGGVKLATAVEDDRYVDGTVTVSSMFDTPDVVDNDIAQFMQWHDDWHVLDPRYENQWFTNTLTPMVQAHRSHRSGNTVDAIDLAYEIEAIDWRTACVEWFERRQR